MDVSIPVPSFDLHPPITFQGPVVQRIFPFAFFSRRGSQVEYKGATFNDLQGRQIPLGSRATTF